MGIRKSGLQSPWLQLALGSLAKHSDNSKAEREKQDEYARKISLMDRQQAYKAQDQSQEQVTRDRARDEGREYAKTQKDADRQYATDQATAATERGYQANIQKKDPFGMLQQGSAPQPGAPGGPGGGAEPAEELGSAMKSSIADVFSEIRKIDDPQERLDAIDQYDPKGYEGPTAAMVATFYDALGKLRQDAESSVKLNKKNRDGVDLAEAELSRGVNAKDRDAWYDGMLKALEGVKDPKENTRLRKDARSVYDGQKPDQVPKMSEPERGKMDLEKTLRGKTGSLAPSEDEIQSQVRKFSINQGIGTAADSTAEGLGDRTSMGPVPAPAPGDSPFAAAMQGNRPSPAGMTPSSAPTTPGVNEIAAANGAISAPSALPTPDAGSSAIAGLDTASAAGTQPLPHQIAASMNGGPATTSVAASTPPPDLTPGLKTLMVGWGMDPNNPEDVKAAKLRADNMARPSASISPSNNSQLPGQAEDPALGGGATQMPMPPAPSALPAPPVPGSPSSTQTTRGVPGGTETSTATSLQMTNLNRVKFDGSTVDRPSLEAAITGYNQMPPEQRERTYRTAENAFLMTKLPGGAMSPEGRNIRKYASARTDAEASSVLASIPKELKGLAEALRTSTQAQRSQR